ncbi:MAG: hypothetical protein ACRYF1_09895 [Janthinobacterium lividum]
MLKDYGLTAHEDTQVLGIQLSTLSGRHEIVRDLSDLWAMVERLAGVALDPLDPRFTSPVFEDA